MIMKPLTMIKKKEDVKLITYKEACERYSLGISTIQKIAKESGALRKIGKSARVNVSVMDAYLDTFTM